MDEITKHVFDLPGMIPLFLAAVGGAAWQKGPVRPLSEATTLSEIYGLGKAKEMEKPFLKILHENSRIIDEICQGYTNSYIDREDLYQEIVYQLWKYYPTFKDYSSISTWIYAVSVHSAILPIRRRQEPDIEYRETLPDFLSEEQDEGLDDRIILLFQKVGNLDRGVLALMMEGFNQKEIAEMLELGQNTVSQRIGRIRKMIENEKK